MRCTARNFPPEYGLVVLQLPTNCSSNLTLNTLHADQPMTHLQILFLHVWEKERKERSCKFQTSTGALVEGLHSTP